MNSLNGKEWPVIVIGAGPTGLTLASLLAKYEIKVLLIERNHSTVQEPRAVSIDDEALRTMQAVGVVDQVLSNVVLGYGSNYYSPLGECFLRVKPKTYEYGYPRRNAFHQPVLEATLRNHLASQPNVQIWFGAEVTDFQQDENGVTIHVRRDDGTETSVRCTYVAACDGAKSFVRQKLGIELTGSTFRERWLIIDLKNTNDTSRDTKVFCDPERPCISLPGPEGTRRFEFMMHPHETDEEMLASENVSRLLKRYSNDHDCAIRRKAVYAFHARIAERWRDGRIFLAGDAAHLSPPFAGQGMNSGIRDAHNLAWKLAMVLQGRLGPALLDTYESERKDHASDMIQLAIRMGHVMMPRNRFSAWAIKNLFKLLNRFRAAYEYFAEMKYKPKPHFREGFFVKQNADADNLVGKLFPQPTVQMVSPQPMLLDEVLGDEFSLLATPGTSPNLFKQVPEELLRHLKTKRVAVLPSGKVSGLPSRMASGVASNLLPVPSDVLPVIDAKGDVSRQLKDMPPGLFLFRPDRYVAAFLPEDDFAPALERVEHLIASTWDAHSLKAASTSDS